MKISRELLQPQTMIPDTKVQYNKQYLTTPSWPWWKVKPHGQRSQTQGESAFSECFLLFFLTPTC